MFRKYHKNPVKISFIAINHREASSPRNKLVREACPKFGHPAQTLDILPKLRTPCPNFGHFHAKLNPQFFSRFKQYCKIVNGL